MLLWVDIEPLGCDKRHMSKSNDATRIAFRKGYRVTETGTVVNALGRTRVLQIKNADTDPRHVFNVGIGNGNRFPVMVHKLQAYQKFGEAMFEPGILVRHLDEDSLNNRPENIALGTPTDNALDRQPEVRRAHAQHAANHNIAYDWKTVERDYFEGGLGFKKLAAKYGMSKGTLSNHFNRIPGWKPKDLTPNWEAIQKHLTVTGCDYAEISKVFGITVRSCNRKLGPLKKCPQVNIAQLDRASAF